MKKLLNSFNYAIQGIKYALRTQRNLKIHFVVTILVILFCTMLNLSRVEWAVILLVINMVIVTEMINTALEKVIDLVTEEYKVLAKIVKDVAAGAVLVSAIFSVIIGFIILYPRVF